MTRISATATAATARAGRTARIALQTAALGALWAAIDWTVRALGVPVPSGVVGLTLPL